VAAMRKVDLEEQMPANKAALYLELIASGLRSGSAYLDPLDLSQRFELPHEVNLKLKVRSKRKKARGKLAVEISWSEDEAAD
jgi:amphi-Trp domain-containing protein